MNPFSHTRTQRKIAFAMLLVWLIAIASGVANACLLESPDAHRHAATAEHSEPHHGAERVGHAATTADQDSDSRISKAPCLKVCDDGSRAVLKQNLGIDHADPGPAPLLTVLWTATVPVTPTLGGLGDLWVPPDGLPFRVRYSRLTL